MRISPVHLIECVLRSSENVLQPELHFAIVQNRRVDAAEVGFFFSSRRRHTRSLRDWSSDVCSSDLQGPGPALDEWRPRLVVSCGFCGGLDPGLIAGDLVLATAVRATSGELLEAPEPARLAAAALLDGVRYRQGELVQATSVATTGEEKRALARSGALALDMESFAVARAAEQAGIPWLALRAVVDPADSPLPEFTRETRRGYAWPALKYALSGPRAAARLIRLARDSRLAGAALTTALRRLGPALSAGEARQ